MKLLGHEKLQKYFTNLVDANNLSHAYFFVGPQHVGKRTFALWLIAYMQCTQADLFATKVRERPCFQCHTCRSITALSYADLTLIEASDKQAISIEQIRDAQRRLSMAPLVGSKTVAIIDNAHEMSLAASNALLKTLEEPTESSMLILVTHLPYQLPLTVYSRCQAVEFSLMPELGQNDELWSEARSRPGLYHALQNNNGLQDLQRECDLFAELRLLSRGARFTKLEALFKESKKHKEEKQTWLKRLELWKTILGKSLVLQLEEQGHERLFALRKSIDDLDERLLTMQSNANVRLLVEDFCLRFL